MGSLIDVIRDIFVKSSLLSHISINFINIYIIDYQPIIANPCHTRRGTQIQQSIDSQKVEHRLCSDSLRTNLSETGKTLFKKKKNVVNKFYVLAIYPKKLLFYSWSKRTGGE